MVRAGEGAQDFRGVSSLLFIIPSEPKPTTKHQSSGAIEHIGLWLLALAALNTHQSWLNGESAQG